MSRRPARRRLLLLFGILALALGALALGAGWDPRLMPAAFGHYPGVAVRPSGPSGPSGRNALPVPSPSPVRSSGAPALFARGPFPASGSGSFVVAPTAGPVMGRAGKVQRFRVAVEAEIGTLDEFTAAVDATLGDARGWTADGRTRLQRVGEGDEADFTIYLATGVTSRRMCAEVGVDTVVNGVPYTSCRGLGRVILNLNRWRSSVPEFVDGKVPLARYRQYLINHEVGHQLGHGHEACPGSGRPAPVMQQQTLGLTGCRPNPWPYLNGRRYSGRPAG